MTGMKGKLSVPVLSSQTVEQHFCLENSTVTEGMSLDSSCFNVCPRFTTQYESQKTRKPDLKNSMQVPESMVM